ncbi:DUF4435 domain-containing protein [Vibrio harveyi]|uniref:DUF4435 domain-containing protein n=1 Tax=Vibrio harveyi TaxID=669 RepID=UPI004067839D
MRQHLTQEIKIGEIRLLFNSPAFRNKKICLVEGDSDLKLFGKVAKSSNLCYEPTNGRKELINVMTSICSEYSDKLFAICDSDFNRLNNSCLSSYNILMTDYHDSEMLILHSNAINGFIDEHVSPEFIEQSKEVLLKTCLDTAYQIGILRWYNESESVNLNFKGLNYSEFVQAEMFSFGLDIEKLISILMKRSKKLDQSITKEYILAKFLEYREHNACEKQVCCGHDVTNLLSIALNRTDLSKVGNLSHLGVESDLRLAYNQSDFEKTSLYTSLMDKWHSLGVAPLVA